MNILTIMNYDWSKEKNLKLCLTWIYHAKKYLSQLDTIYIYSEKKLHNDLYGAFSDSIPTFKSVVYPYPEHTLTTHFSPQHHSPVSNHNFWYKLYVTCHTDFSFLFIDCDALIVDKICELEDIFSNTIDSVFFIDHESNIPKQTDRFPPFINSGVYAMNDPDHKIYNFKRILEYAKNIGFFPTFKDGRCIPGTDQAIIKSYFDHINYDYHHPILNNRYNASSCMIDKSKKNYYKIIHYWGSQREGFPYI
jgi:hypothetical protein